MKMANVGVIIPVYNRSTTVLEALDSVAAQTVSPRSLVVVDDGSTDGTARAVEQWIAATPTEFPKRLLRQTNRGPSAARNRGTEEADACELFAFLDSDDLWPRDFLERTCGAMAANLEAVAATCDERYAVSDGVGPEFFRTLTYLDTRELADNATRWHLLKYRGIMPATIVRAADFRRVGRYDETMLYGEDRKLHLYLSALGPWLHVPGEAVTVRLGVCQTRGEEGNLQLHGTPSNDFKQIRFIEEFLAHDWSRDFVFRDACFRSLAVSWYTLGRALIRKRKTGSARKCFIRSIYWQRSFHKPWFRLARTYLPGFA